MILNHGHLCAHGIVEIGKLNSDGSASYHNHLLWLRLQGHSLAITDHFYPVLRQVRKLSASGSGGNNDMRGADGLLFFSPSHLYLFPGQQCAVAIDDGNLILFHQELHSLTHRIGHSSRAIDHFTEVITHRFRR